MNPLLLLPQPQSLRYDTGVFDIADNRVIVLAGGPLPDLSAIGQRLQTNLRRRCGCEWQLAATGYSDGAAIGAILTIAPQRVSQPQAYTLAITPERILIEAHDLAGAFYAVCTLVQIIDQSGAQLPTLDIHDWPDFPARGVMLDISRDKVPTLETLFGLVDTLASWKINQLQLYTEHTFAYARHGDVWAAASPITHQDILLLDRYCRERFVELVANQNTFGHMERWLRHERYAHLAEVHGVFDTPWGTASGPFSICPEDPESLLLVHGLLDELLPHFTSDLVNINCDETFDLGQGRSRAVCQERGTGQVYLDFLTKVIAKVHEYGRTAQFWGDIIIQHPELVAHLPNDVIALEWGYEANHPFAEHTAIFAASNVPFYVCPGTSSWTSLAGRTTNMLGNLAAAAEHGLHNGAIGYLVTDWGDHGHWQQLPVSYAGFAAGAAFGWAWEANRSLDLPKLLDQYVFRDGAGVMGQLAYDLGNVYTVMGDTSSNSTGLFWMLQKPLATLASEPRFTADQLVLARNAIDTTSANLAQARMDRPDHHQIIDEFAQTARLMRHACTRGLIALASNQAADAVTQQELLNEVDTIISEQRRLWLLRNRPGGLADSIARMEGLRSLSV